MEEFLVHGNTLPEAYHAALCALQMRGAEGDCSDWNTTQKEVSMTFVVSNPLMEPMISKCTICGPKELEQYVEEMVDGILDWSVDAGKEPYTYHDRMTRWTFDYAGMKPALNQLGFVVDELKRSPSSRRAVIDIRNNRDDMTSNDPACLQHIQFFIRGGRLDCKVLFRSNDAVKAAFMNAFALIMLQKRVADELGIPVGTYTHRANSFHAYARDFALLDSYYNRIMRGDDLGYSYEDDWKEQMDSYKSEIKEDMTKLKNKVESYEL